MRTPQLLTLEPHFVRQGCRGSAELAKTLSVFDTRTSCERVAISWRLVGTACGLKGEQKKKERDRDRGQEREREDVKMRRCEDEKMIEDDRRCEDLKM